MRENKGVFNGPQHAEEIDMLLRGDYKQFQMFPIDVSNQGYAPGGGNQGLFELEGNAVSVVPAIFNTETNVETFSAVMLTSAGRARATLYIKFNHKENPWLPLGLANPTINNPNIPCGYCLTFGRFWLYVANPQPGQALPILVSRGVSMYSPGFGPVVIGGYQAPTWQKLK